MRKATRRVIQKLHSQLDRRIKVAIYILPGQAPGPYFEEHDGRIIKVLQVWQACLILPSHATILCTSGTPDCRGLTVARYMQKQLLYYANQIGFSDLERDLLERSIVIGEETSGSSAHQILYSREDLIRAKYDLVILVSNWWHLLVAGSYFKHLIPGVHFAKEWSSSKGCLEMGLPRFILREIVHYLVSLTFDRSGHRFDRIIESKLREWEKLSLPPIPPTAIDKPR